MDLTFSYYVKSKGVGRENRTVISKVRSIYRWGYTPIIFPELIRNIRNRE